MYFGEYRVSLQRLNRISTRMQFISRHCSALVIVSQSVKENGSVPKNSRPDIQVLEDRIVRLKAQLLEYKDIRLYKATKNRLSAVSAELQECMMIIDDIVSADTNNISASSLSAIDDSGLGISEFSEDGDLVDTALLKPSEDDSQSSDSYSAKEIVSTYSSRLKEYSESEGRSTGIIQVNQFWQVLNFWYQNRFTPLTRNPNFHFKANRIHEWIDLLILAAGHALHEGQFPSFVSDMNSWTRDLNTPKDDAFVLPFCVMRMKRLDSECCTQEAVLIEDMIKPFLYTSEFYPDELHSVKKIVITNSGFTEEDLDLETILQQCPRLLRTSSFDIAKYQKGVA